MIPHFNLTFFPAKLIVASLAAIALVLLAFKTSAARRHTLALAGLVALLALPLMGLLVPSQRIPLPYSTYKRIGYISNPVFGVAESMQLTNKTVAYEPPSGLATVLQYSPIFEVYGWLFGFLLLLGRVGLGYRRLGQIRRKAKPIGQEGVYLSEDVAVPMAFCLSRPAIFLPPDALAWHPSRLDRIVKHERAHIKRRDCLWNLIGQLACALYWPVPTVWILQRMARKAAEQACDDLVLRAGNKPADYAQDLLDSARDIKLRWPSAALPLVTKSEVASRIKRILNPRTKRGSTGLGTLIIAAVFATGIAVPLASASVDYANAPWINDLHRGDDSNDQVGPSAEGWATPGTWSGTPQNHYVGTTSDGRKIELLQITHLGDHGFEAWKPDGTMIPHANSFGAKQTWWLSGPTRLEIVYRFPTKAVEDLLRASQGSGPGAPEQPQMFSAGRLLPSDGTGKRILACYVDLLNSHDKTGNYTFSLSDKPWVLAGSVQLRPDGSADVKSVSLKKLSFAPSERVVGHGFDRNGHLKDVPPHILLDNHVVTTEMNAPKVAFQIPHRFFTDVRVEAVDKEGRVHDELHVSGPIALDDTSEVHWSSVALKDLKAIRIYTRKMENVEFLGVHVQPNRP